jgi:hypothetical protein
VERAGGHDWLLPTARVRADQGTGERRRPSPWQDVRQDLGQDLGQNLGQGPGRRALVPRRDPVAWPGQPVTYPLRRIVSVGANTLAAVRAGYREGRLVRRGCPAARWQTCC